MKLSELFLFFLLFLSFNMVIGQSQKEIERNKNKVEIFNDEENANIQLVFYEKTKAMHLLEDVEEQYFMYILHYAHDMGRLDDKDLDLSDEEIKKQLKILIDKMDSKVKPILTNEQYKLHKDNFNSIMKAAYFKSGWEWTEDY